MRECWLRPNRRSLYLGLVLPVVMAALGLILLFGPASAVSYLALRWLGAVLAAAGIWLSFTVVYYLCQPRLGSDGRNLLVYLRPGAPVPVPLEHVEIFFKGQSGAVMRGPDGKEPEVATIVVKLADAAKEFHHVDVRPNLGLWCEGYITILGTWCEPITPDLILALNQRLRDFQRAQRSAAAVEQTT